MQGPAPRLVAVCSLAVAVTNAQQWSAWSPLATADVPLLERQGLPSFAVARDEVRGQTVLFGGTASGSETWEWNRTGWCRRFTARTPSPRTLAGIAFDSVRRQILLFGGTPGRGGGALGDTWAYDGDEWTELLPARSPSPRAGHAMATDFARGRIVVHGGHTHYPFPLPGAAVNDTWEWDGTAWHDVTPTQRAPWQLSARLAWNGATNRVALVNTDDRVREWDGTAWHVIVPPVPLPLRIDPCVATDPTGRGVLLHGGSLGIFSFLRETWRWDGSAWTRLADMPFDWSGPGSAGAPSDSDAIIHYTAMSAPYHGTHRYRSSVDAWQFVTTPQPFGDWRVAVPLLDRSGLLMVNEATWFVDEISVRPWPGQPQTPPLIDQIVADPSTGTYLGITLNGTCHRFDGASWNPAPSFPAAIPRLAGYDSGRQAILALGLSAGNVLQLWSCDRNGWTQLATPPAGDYYTQAAVDPDRNVVVLHGPAGSYEWSGTFRSIPSPLGGYGKLLPHPTGGVALFSSTGSFRWDGVNWQPFAAREEPAGCDPVKQRCWRQFVLTPTFFHPFAAAVTQSAPRLGATVGIVLHAPEAPGRYHFLFLALAPEPGIDVPWPQPIRLPLANDALFAASLAVGSGGPLDANGRAAHSLTIPFAPELAGLRCHAAGLLLPSGGERPWVSNSPRIWARP